METKTIRVEGNPISVQYLQGSDRAVLLIHGNSSCKEVFYKQIAALKSLGRTIIIPDLPGHGSSEDSRSPRLTYSFPGYARVLAGLLRKLDVKDCDIVGWSLGGHIGLELWAQHSFVRSLLVSGTPPIELSGAGADQGFISSSSMSLAGKRNFTLADVRRYGVSMLGEQLPMSHRLFSAIRRTDGRARYWMMKNGLSGIGADQKEAVQRISRPLAIVQGSEDPFINMDYLKSLPYRNLWQGHPIFLKSGHAPHWQRPKIFNKLMRDFLISAA